MKLYYNFSILDNKDFEIDISDERVSLFLATITEFTAEDIIKEMDSFKSIYADQIIEYFSPLAKKEFDTLDDAGEKSITSVLRDIEISKRTRKAFILRQALKKQNLIKEGGK